MPAIRVVLPHKFRSMVESCGGEVLASRLWNEQRLAYAIEGHRKGAYWLTYFRMETDRVVEFNRACRLNENIVRNLTLKVEPRLVDTLVAHARGEAPARPKVELDRRFEDVDVTEDEPDLE